MICIKTYVDADGIYKGFLMEGHAEYADPGEDIICAAVSVLAQNAVNSIEAFTEDEISYSVEEGYLDFKIEGKTSAQSQLLLNSMVLGLEGIEEAYQADGEHQYLTIQTEEV